MPGLKTERLKALRESMGISQAELAKKMSVTPPTISRIENGEREPNLQFLKNLATFFNVSVDYLLGLTDGPIPKNKEFHLSDYLPDSVKETPEKLIEIGNYLIELGNKLKKDLNK